MGLGGFYDDDSTSAATSVSREGLGVEDRGGLTRERPFEEDKDTTAPDSTTERAGGTGGRRPAGEDPDT